MRDNLWNCVPVLTACMVAIQAMSPEVTGRCDALSSSGVSCCQHGSSSCCGESRGCCCRKKSSPRDSTACLCEVQQPVPLAPRDSETTQVVRQLLTKVDCDAPPLHVAIPGLPGMPVNFSIRSIPQVSVNTLLCVWLT